MSYDWRYINKQIFPSSIGFTLLIEDTDSNGEREYRIEKTFRVDDGQIDSEFLRLEALKEIEKIKLINDNSVVEEVPPDEALSDG